MQLRSLFFPRLGFRIRQVQQSDGNEDWERSESIRLVELFGQREVILTFYPIRSVGVEIGKKCVCVTGFWSEDIGGAEDPVK